MAIEDAVVLAGCLAAAAETAAALERYGPMRASTRGKCWWIRMRAALSVQSLSRCRGRGDYEAVAAPKATPASSNHGRLPRNGATVGGLRGLQAKPIPNHWLEPWNGRVGVNLAGPSRKSAGTVSWGERRV